MIGSLRLHDFPFYGEILCSSTIHKGLLLSFYSLYPIQFTVWTFPHDFNSSWHMLPLGVHLLPSGDFFFLFFSQSLLIQ